MHLAMRIYQLPYLTKEDPPPFPISYLPIRNNSRDYMCRDDTVSIIIGVLCAMQLIINTSVINQHLVEFWLWSIMYVLYKSYHPFALIRCWKELMHPFQTGNVDLNLKYYLTSENKGYMLYSSLPYCASSPNLHYSSHCYMPCFQHLHMFILVSPL